MTLSERITELLNKTIKEERRISQVDLAKIMEVAPASVNKWLSGGTPSIDKLPKLCEVLGITPNELFAYHPNSFDIETEELIKRLKEYPEYKKIVEILISQIVKDISRNEIG